MTLRLVAPPTRWSAARVLVAAIVLPWVVPMPWQHADARVPAIVNLAPAGWQFCEAHGGCP